jgi:putative transposase
MFNPDWVLGGFAKTKNVAQQRYREFVQQGKGQPSPWQSLKNQIYLGDDDFVLDMQCKLDPEQSLKDIPKKQKQALIKPLDYFVNLENTRNENMALAYLSGRYTLEQVGSHFGVSYATVSRAVKQKERGVD